MTVPNPTQPEDKLEPGAGEHVHRFNAVRVPPQFGHSYLRCAYRGLAKHLSDHDPAVCDLCSARASVVAPQKDLRIRDREGNVVTQGAFNALMVKVDSLTEDAERAQQRETDARIADSFRFGWSSENTFRQVAETIAAAIRVGKDNDNVPV